MSERRLIASNDPEFIKLLEALGAPPNLTFAQLTAYPGEVVTLKATSLASVPSEVDGKLAELAHSFALLPRRELELLLRQRQALAALSERIRDLRADGNGFLAANRTCEHFVREIREARRAEHLEEWPKG